MIYLSPPMVENVDLRIILTFLDPPQSGAAWAAARDSAGVVVAADAVSWDSPQLIADFSGLSAPRATFQLRLRGSGETRSWWAEIEIGPEVPGDGAAPSRAVREFTILWARTPVAPLTALGGYGIVADDSLSIHAAVPGTDDLSGADVTCAAGAVAGVGSIGDPATRTARFAWGGGRLGDPGIFPVTGRVTGATEVHDANAQLHVQPSLLPSPVNDWILALGQWDDGGNWDDTEFWKDGV